MLSVYWCMFTGPAAYMESAIGMYSRDKKANPMPPNLATCVNEYACTHTNTMNRSAKSYCNIQNLIVQTAASVVTASAARHLIIPEDSSGPEKPSDLPGPSKYPSFPSCDRR